ncbi:MAG: ComEC/Rec2 family competence protein [Clostridia bacterium]
MEKKQKKEYVQIIIFSILIVVLSLSTIWTKQISKGIKNLLFKSDLRVNNDLVVHFIDVGQGDGIAVKFPNQQVMLIDAGPKFSQNYIVDYIKSNVLSSDNDLVIDYMILTHPDIDHSGGMSAIFEEFSVKKFFRPNIASVSENVDDFTTNSNFIEYGEVINRAYGESDIEINIINQNYEFCVGDVSIKIFAPIKVYETTNEMSPLIKITYLNKSFLFAGDIEFEGENDMLNTYVDELNIDVLKVSHHGSNDATSTRFIKSTSPDYAIISVGSNAYGHPSFSTIANLQSFKAEVLTTKQGAIRFVCSDNYFGILNNKVTHSYQYIAWWPIVICINVVLTIFLVKVVIKTIKSKRLDIENNKKSA